METNIIDFLLRKLRENRDIPLVITKLVEEFYGPVTNRFDYKQLYFFQVHRIVVSRAFRSLREKTGLHIYNINSGWKIIETDKDFKALINKFNNLIKSSQKTLEQIKIDMKSEKYRKKIIGFYGLTTEKSFNEMVEKKLALSMKEKYEKQKKARE